MKKVLLLLIIISSVSVFSQDEKFLVISRNTDYIQLDDTTNVRIMGYTRTLSTPSKIPGPLLVFTEGDSVEIDLWNVSQGAPHTIHLHGLDVNQANDGVPMLSFDVAHMDHGFYRFKAPQPGTYLYHCHVTSSVHVQAGMYGMVVVTPKYPELTWDGGYKITVDNQIITSEVDVDWHHDSIIEHDHTATALHQVKVPVYDPTFFLANGYGFNSVTDEAIEISTGNNNLLRLANIGNYGNKFVFPQSIKATVISSDGRKLPTEYVADSLIILPGERFQVLLNSSQLGNDSLAIKYFSLNTQLVEGLHYYPILVDVIESVEEQRVYSNFSIYPNPSTSQVNFDFKNELPNAVEILDITGRMVHSIKNGSIQKTTTFRTSNLKRGEYLVKCVYNTKVVTRSLIIE
jgi:hypothetical protein